LLLEAADRRRSIRYPDNMASNRRSRTKRANEEARTSWHRTTRYVRYRMPGRGLIANDALSGPDAPLTRRGRLIWWSILAVVLGGGITLIALSVR